jgi:uncharacterized membrane protein YeiH
VERFDLFLALVGLVATFTFSAAGALTASRKQLDMIGFLLIGFVTAFGGGTVRDLLLGVRVFWMQEPLLVLAATIGAVLVFFTAHLVERRFVWLLWADAIGLALFASIGAFSALRLGAEAWAAVLMGVVTATFGGILRDIICAEVPLILRREIYATAAFAGALVFVLIYQAGLGRDLALLAGSAVAFALRAAGIVFGWSLPTYRARPGRDYPDER